MILYHGTSKKFDEFDISKSPLDVLWFTSNAQKAQQYSKSRPGLNSRVITVEVPDAKYPILSEDKGSHLTLLKNISNLKNNKEIAAWVGQETFVVLNPDIIKIIDDGRKDKRMYREPKPVIPSFDVNINNEVGELPGSPRVSPVHPDRIRIYHGTYKDFDNFRSDKNYFASNIGFAREYAAGSEAPQQTGMSIMHPSMQRIITADIPVNIYMDNIHKFSNEIVLPADIANKHVVDDGRNSPLYGDLSCYNENYLPLDTVNCKDPNNRIFNIPEGEKFFGSYAEGDYHANYFIMPGPFEKRIVHVFDKYFYDAKKKKIYYQFDDGSVLVTKGKDPLENGFVTLGMLDVRTYKKAPPKIKDTLDGLWMSYDNARSGKTKMHRMPYYKIGTPRLVNTKQKHKTRPMWFKPPRMPKR